MVEHSAGRGPSPLHSGGHILHAGYLNGYSIALHAAYSPTCCRLDAVKHTKMEIIVFGPKEDRLKVSVQLESMTIKTRNRARHPTSYGLNSHVKTIYKLCVLSP